LGEQSHFGGCGFAFKTLEPSMALVSLSSDNSTLALVGTSMKAWSLGPLQAMASFRIQSLAPKT
jgi:hypothetical protein